MTTHRRLRWGAAALVVVLVGLLGGSHLCGVALEKGASDPGMRPIGGGALACTEFWLNRYQTLLGAFAALIAGYAAWRGAMTQVARADTQIAFINKQFAIDRVQYLNEKLRPVDDLYLNINTVVTWLNFSIEKIPDLRQLAASISSSAGEQDWSHIKIYEKQYQPLLGDMNDGARAVKRSLDAIHTTMNDATLPEDIREGVRRTAFDLVTTYQKLMATLQKFRTDVGITSNFEIVTREYDRICSNSTPDMARIDASELEICARISDQRTKLLALRKVAEAIAEA